MGTRKKSRGSAFPGLLSDALKAFAIVIVLAMLVGLTGCGHTLGPPSVKTKSKVELAIEQLPDRFLVPCPRLGPVPGNSVGDFLDDSIDAMSFLGICAAQMDEVILYLTPLVETARKP